MASPDIELMAHLMRRAGFGATYKQLEEYAANKLDRLGLYCLKL